MKLHSNPSMRITNTPDTQSSVSRKIVTTLLLVLVSTALISCTSSKRTTKVDDSVDYKSARVLPPLKQNRNAAVRPLDAPAVTQTPMVESESEARADSQAAPSVAVSNVPVAEAPSTAIPVESSQNISAEIVTAKPNHRRLRITAIGRPAWLFVREQARQGGLSIFSRDAASQRLYIGCGDIPAAVASNKSSRWTIFKRDKKSSSSEHCSLKLVTEGSATLVSVLGKNGREVASEFAEPVLTALLPNQ